jgi:hypothetical protein
LFGIGLAIFKLLLIVLDDVDLFELYDHGQASYSLVEEVGDLQGPVETVQRAAQVQVLESLLSEEAVAQNADGDGSVSAFLVRFVDLQLLLQLYTILDGRPESPTMYFLG